MFVRGVMRSLLKAVLEEAKGLEPIQSVELGRNSLVFWGRPFAGTWMGQRSPCGFLGLSKAFDTISGVFLGQLQIEGIVLPHSWWGVSICGYGGGEASLLAAHFKGQLFPPYYIMSTRG